MPLTVRAKFLCKKIEPGPHRSHATFKAAFGNKLESEDFTKDAPNGTLDIFIDNGRAASNFFEPGEYYFLRFIRAE